MMGFVLQANQIVTQIRNVIAVIKGSEEPNRYSVALLLIKTPLMKQSVGCFECMLCDRGGCTRLAMEWQMGMEFVEQCELFQPRRKQGMYLGPVQSEGPWQTGELTVMVAWAHADWLDWHSCFL